MMLHIKNGCYYISHRPDEHNNNYDTNKIKELNRYEINKQVKATPIKE